MGREKIIHTQHCILKSKTQTESLHSVLIWWFVMIITFLVDSKCYCVLPCINVSTLNLNADDLGLGYAFWIIDIFVERCTNEMRRNEDFRKWKTTNYNYWLNCLFASSIRPVALTLFHLIILNAQIRKYGNVYRAIISTIVQIISDYKVNVHCSLLTHSQKIPVSQTFSEKRSLATVQVFIRKFFIHQWVFFFFFRKR